MPASLLAWSLQTSGVLATEQRQIERVRGPGMISGITILGPEALSGRHSLGLKVAPDVGAIGTFDLGDVNDLWDLQFTPALRSPLVGFSPFHLDLCIPFGRSSSRIELTLESGPPESVPLTYLVHVMTP